MEPKLKGVVIITLPPPGDPSKGKTITAFAIPDDAEDFIVPSTAAERQQPLGEVPRQPSTAPSAFSERRFSLKKAAWGIAGFSLLVSALWACLFSEAPFEFLQSSEEVNRRNDAGSLVLPLYPKPGSQRLLHQGEVKLGSAGGRGRGREMEQRKVRHSRTAAASVVASSSAVNSSAVFSVRGNIFPDGLYYTSIHVGNPPRRYFLDVDTGSDLTWIQCDAPCQSCAKGPNPLYKPTKGKIVSPRDSLCLELQSGQNSRPCDTCHQCDYEIAYADHSSSMGVLARDNLKLMMVNQRQVSPSFVFGCAYDQQGQLLASPAKTDGILGLSGAKVSLPSQLSDQHIIANVVGHWNLRMLAFSLVHPHKSILLDHFVYFLPMDCLKKDPNTVLRNYYQTEVAKVSYGNVPLGARRSRSYMDKVVFDTGSSYTYFTKEMYGDLITLLKGISAGLVRDESDETLPVCWRPTFHVRSVKDVRQFFDPLTLHFGKKWWIMPRSFQIPPEGYLIVNRKGNICLGILNGTEVHDGSTNILGGTYVRCLEPNSHQYISLRGHLLVYDNVDRQVGWVQSDCAQPQRAVGFPFLF
ncbi:hypothetical protein Taro_036048 [Colocasia esculenta]|uniref:Peptidase A1 domain-containing protein n=1 Tax=Colocasia esculenta TaxID=4460 RepID=A0A843W5M6_COLES|nr:hypothetical protein [Colocasia esculenta]